MTIAHASERRGANRTLAVSGLLHALHDGYTDLIYVLLPIWQAEFGLSYSLLAVLRGLYAGSMAALQVPSGRLAERIDGRVVLALGTVLAALGYLLAGFSGGAMGLCASLALSGAGSSVQHPVASAAVSRAYGSAARGPIGTYNFTGDIGKAALPALTSLLVAAMPWRHALWAIAALGLATAAVIAVMPRISAPGRMREKPSGEGRGGFGLLCAIGGLDTAARMGFLTFLPFMLLAKGADMPMIGSAFAAVFVGGALGKFACGWLGQRVGVLRATLLTEGATVCLIAAVMAAPLWLALALLPVVGIALNGTSSVLYGTVPELAPSGRVEHAFAVFYTFVIGAGAVAPVLYGVLGDIGGWSWGTSCSATTALLTLPLALLLAPRLASR